MEKLTDKIATGADKILIVDDNEQVCVMLSNFLTSFGYSILVAVDGQDAIEKYKQHIDNIHLIIMDIVMPQKDGIHAYVELLEINPDIKVILMTGYDAGHLDELNDLGVPLPDLVQKPFSPIDLLHKITEYTSK